VAGVPKTKAFAGAGVAARSFLRHGETDLLDVLAAPSTVVMKLVVHVEAEGAADVTFVAVAVHVPGVGLGVLPALGISAVRVLGSVDHFLEGLAVAHGKGVGPAVHFDLHQGHSGIVIGGGDLVTAAGEGTAGGPPVGVVVESSIVAVGLDGLYPLTSCGWAPHVNVCCMREVLLGGPLKATR